MDFIGLSGAVLCLAADWSADRAVTGSDESGGVFRLWDLKQGHILSCTTGLGELPKSLSLRWDSQLTTSVGGNSLLVWEFPSDPECSSEAGGSHRWLRCPHGWISCV